MAGLLLGSLAILSCKDNTDHEAISRAQKAKALAEEQAALKIGVMPTLDCLPIYLLKDSLLYDTTKVDIRLKLFNAHLDIDTALVGGSIQVGASDMVRAAYTGRRGTWLKSLTATNAYWQLFTHPDAKVDSLSKLADKTIGMTRHSVTDMLTDETIEKGKPKSLAFKAQINNVRLRLRMLQNDELEAAWLTEPQATQARLLGMKLLVDNSKDSTRMGVLVYHEDPMDDLTARQRQYEAFQTAYNKACEAINKKGLAYYAALLKKYMGLDDKEVRALPAIKFEGIVAPRNKDTRRAKAYR